MATLTRKPKQPTISIRFGSLRKELWLNARGEWDVFESRKRFSGPDAADQAEAFLRRHKGDDFHNYGTFANS